MTGPREAILWISAYLAQTFWVRVMASKGHGGSSTAVIWECQSIRAHMKLQEPKRCELGPNDRQAFRERVRKYRISNEQNTL